MEKMENEVFTPLLEEFLLSPLVCWVKTVSRPRSDGSHLSEFMTLVDGAYLNDIMIQINPKSSVQRTHKKVNNDPTLRIQNLSILIQQIKSYYQETLQQLVMMSLPDVLVLGRTPLSEQALEEMRKLLLLLLGCAVQCDRKEEYIDRIQTLLDFDTKAAIAAHIQEVTHNQENVLDLQCLDEGECVSQDKDTLLKHVSFHLKRLVDERDQHAETIVSLTLERDCGHISPALHVAPLPGESPSIRRTESIQHLSVELADAKAKIRRLRQELEEKTEQLQDCRQELDNMQTEVKRLQQENLQLMTDARSLRAYRDELDALREKAIRVDKLESEVMRYKEKLHDIEFYRTRVEELKEDNHVLLETKIMLEDQLESFRARSDKLHELEKENLQLKNKIHDMEMERDIERKRMEELLEENLMLEMAQKQSMDESLHLGWELEQLSKTTPELTEVPQKSLGHEVNELTSSQLLKLEKENQMLMRMLEEMRTCNESKSLEKDNYKLRQKLQQLQTELTSDRESLRRSESLSADLLKEKAQLEKTLETLRENADRQVKGLEQENEHLNQTITSLRQRSQVSSEARVKDIEKENRVLHESIKETSSKLNKMEFERKQLRQDLEHYKEKGERAEELEMEVHRLEREKESLQKRLATLAITCEKVEVLEKENADLEAESRKLKKAADGLRNLSFQLEVLEKENAQLDEENLELRRFTESLRSTGAKAAQLELENRELENERTQLRKSLELLKASSKKTERLEVSYQGLDIENQRLKKVLENSSRKIHQLEGELQEMETENQNLQQSLEELKISSKGLEQLAQENNVLEQENTQLEKDKKQLEKENKRLRQQAEIKDSKLDEDNLRISHLEKENRALSKEVTTLKETCGRIKDLEKDNKELVKQASIDKKTLVTLREELVDEKLKTQQINNDLEKLTHELEKIGLNKEGLLGGEESSDDRFKLLESKLESTLKSSLEIKAEKIAALEARLQESFNLNQQLRQELKTVKKNYEALRQRQEEECMVQSSPCRGREDAQSVSKWAKESQDATRELLKVKDRLIEVERNNATLQAEKQALRTQLKQLETQSSNLQAQILALQRQTASIQENNTTLQTQNAKLQVENSTLNSQSAALMSQNTQLQTHQSSTESERDAALREKEELRTVYDLLLHDHEKLSNLHDRQASEYEDLIGKHGELKSAHKSLDVQHRSLDNRYNQLLKQKTELEQLEKELKSEREKMISENKRHQETAAEYHKLKEEHHTLNSTYHQLLKDNELLQMDHKALKSQVNTARLEQTRLEAEFSKLKEQYQQLDITSTKLTNQCELLSQLKGNLEEENRHLLDQIQTLMLQNRTLLEQTMESKDLFHVEQRQYIDKLNELRRQKEKLEEKIMDQYKFYDPSPPRRRGNWITLKMRKLIKPKSRERMRSLTQTPSRSESSEGFLTLPHPDSQDNSSVGSGSNSLEDTVTQRSGRKKVEKSQSQASSNALKKLPFMRNRSKEKDRMKAIYRRSMSMNDLLQTMALSEGQWSSSIDHLEAPDEMTIGAQHGQEFGSMDYSSTAAEYATLNLTRGRRAQHNTNERDNASSDDITPLSSEESSVLRAQGVMNGAVSRPHSESSGDVSLSLDSPLRQTPSQPSAQDYTAANKRRTKSAGSETVSLQHRDESSDPQEDALTAAQSLRLSGATPQPSREHVKGRGILRSASGKAMTADSSGARASQTGRPSLRKAESTRVKGSDPPRSSLSSLAKATSVSEQLDVSSSSGLPRASSVISTAEGSVRRTSIHDLLSKDSRQPVLVDPVPSSREYGSVSTAPAPNTALPKSASEPCSIEEPELASLQAFLGPSFTVDSFFLDSIFSEPALKCDNRNQNILSLNTSLVSNISGPPHKPPQNKSRGQSSAPPDDAEPEDAHLLWYEYGCV
ncbi:girdin isoform X2 [Myxocyprinus asiaticus]|uniref:girdin isoform X2 n=1 Tax=Myxocyprinus asiaticus TaxID=70543 RepID=UPI0022229C74|nr:girdin isoform X2 [Myxocyprinus asiaticus]